MCAFFTLYCTLISNLLVDSTVLYIHVVQCADCIVVTIVYMIHFWVCKLKDEAEKWCVFGDIGIVTEPCMLHADTGPVTNKMNTECGTAPSVYVCVYVYYILFYTVFYLCNLYYYE